MNEGEVTWVVAAFALTFASFLLVSGRISDVYGPSAHFCSLRGIKTHVVMEESVFVIGAGCVSVLSLVAGFMNSKIPLIVLRALLGICGFYSSKLGFDP